MRDTTNTSRLVLIANTFEESWLKRLQSHFPELRIEQRRASRVEDIPAELWRDVEVLYALFTLPSPEQAPKLRWVQLYSAGANQALESSLLQRGVTFTTASSVHAINIGEYVFATILAWSHRVEAMFEWKRRGQWPPTAEGHAMFMPEELQGKTLNIVGYGSIGRQVAKLGKAFGMRVLATGRSSAHHDRGFLFPDVGDPEGTLPDQYYAIDQLHAALQESDSVVITVPLTPSTKGMFDEAAFRSMKKTAFLVNIARGDVCDEAALIRALEEKWIAGAALDVFHQEPLPSDNPLFRLPNVIISPHIAGITPHYDERAAMIFEENLRRYVAGEPLYNVVDKEQGY